MGWSDSSWGSGGGGGGAITFKGWGYQDFTSGTISGTAVTLTANENGTGIVFSAAQIINSSAVIVRKADNESKAYTGTNKLFSTKVEIASHTGTSITLSGIPHTSWGDLRIFYYYDYSTMGMPINYSIAPKSVSANLFTEFDSLFITEEELGDGTKSANFSAVTIDTLAGILKGTAGSVGIASAGIDYEPPVTKGNLTETTSSVLTISGGTGAVIGSGATIAVTQAASGISGYLGGADWNIFNNKQDYLSAGVCCLPAYTREIDGSITLGNGSYNLYTDADGNSKIKKYAIAGANYLLTDMVTNYIIADYNAGTPIIRVTTNVLEIDQISIIPIYTIFREGIDLHILDWDTLGNALANKMSHRIVKTERFARQSGLMLTETATRVVNISDGIVWYGVTDQNLDTFKSDVALNYLDFYYHVAGVWTKSSVTQYNNTQYDNGTSLQSLLPSRYAVNWIYRGIEVDKHAYIVLGTGDYTLSEATSAQPPSTLPILVGSQSMLVGRIIVKSGDATATQIDSAFDIQFSPSLAASHGDLVDRDIVGNHAKLIPIIDSITSEQITKADGLTVIMNVDSTNSRVGINTTAPDKALEINEATGNCLRLTYNDSNGTAANYTDFAVSSSGDLTITPSGGDVLLGGRLDMQGYLADNLDGLTHHTTGVTDWIFKNEDLNKSTTFTGNFATVDTELLRLDYSTNRVGIGTISPPGKLSMEATYTDANSKNLFYCTFYSGAGIGLQEPTFRLRQSNGTLASPTATATGRSLGTFYFQGYDGTTFTNGAYITTAVNGTVSSGVVPTDIAFATSSTGSATERMRITGAGNIGIGTNSTGTAKVRISGNATGATSWVGVYNTQVVQSDITGIYYGFATEAATQAIAFSLSAYYHYAATQTTFGVGSAVGSQIGYLATASLVGASNNFGFYGNIPAGANRFNIYMNGTAQNYIAGNLGLGKTVPATTLHLTGLTDGTYPTITLERNDTTVSADDIYGVLQWYSNDTSHALGTTPGLIRMSADGAQNLDYPVAYMTFHTSDGASPVERVRITSKGRMGLGTTAPDYKLDINASDGACLKLIYNDADGGAANYANIQMTDKGYLTITPSGGTTVINGKCDIGLSGSDYTEFESDGTMLCVGNATTWDDINLGAATLRSASTAPDFAQIGTSGLYTYYFDGVTRDETVHGTIELPHSYKEASSISFHVHWMPTTAGAGNVVWNLTYQWVARDGTMSGTTSTSTNMAAVAAGGTAYVKKTSELTITGAGKDISSHLMFNLTRLQSDGSDTYAADVGLVQAGIHFEQDTLGSRQITTK